MTHANIPGDHPKRFRKNVALGIDFRERACVEFRKRFRNLREAEFDNSGSHGTEWGVSGDGVARV